MLVAAGLYVASDADLDLLRDYAAAGGHLVVGIRTGYGDEEARARVEVAPARLARCRGRALRRVLEPRDDIAVAATGPFAASDGATARLWADGLINDGAEVLARYEHPRFGDFPAVTTNAHGAGRVTVVGTVPSPALAADLVRWAVPSPVADRLASDRELPVTVASGSLPDGRRAGSSSTGAGPRLPSPSTARSPTRSPPTAHAAGTELPLAAWSTLTLIDG